MLSIKEKLVHSFPGAFGTYLSIHFGSFLNETIDNLEKEQAYLKIVDFLDQLTLSDETEQYLEQNLPLIQTEDIENISSAMRSTIQHDPTTYMNNHRESIDAYIQFRTSERYKSTPAYKMQQVLLDLQRNSGYYDLFIPNLKILSHSYCEYSEKLQKANQLFMEGFPQAKRSIFEN